MFLRAIVKYGWDNIKHDVLYVGLTKKEAETKEMELIAYYKSNDGTHGYNVQNGGNTTGTHSEATKKKISEANKGKNKGKPSYWKDKKLPEYIVINLRLLANKRSKKVCQYSLNGDLINVHNSLCETARQTGIDKASISRCFKNRVLTAGGYIFLLDEDKDKIIDRLKDIQEANEKNPKFKKGHISWNAGKSNVYTEKQLEAMSKERSARFKDIEYLKKYTKPVIQFDLNGNFINEYISAAEAERYLGINGISAVCKNRRKTAGGYKWKYKEVL